MASIPEEIRDKKQWTFSYTAEDPRRPRHWHYNPDGGMTFNDAVKTVKRLGKGYYFGFYTTARDPYVIGDIDKLKNPNDPFAELPPELGFLLKTKETYSEISPSGTGIRFFFKLMSVEIKSTLSGSIYKNKEESMITLSNGEVKPRDIHINVGSPWMRMSGIPTAFAKSKIAVVSIQELEKCFHVRYKKDEAVHTPATIDEKLSLPPFTKIQEDVMSLPLDQNPRIQRAYRKTFEEVSYDHYDFWIKVTMALHDYSIRIPNSSVPCLQLLIDWSKGDKESYTGEKDIMRHWNSMNGDRANRVSYNTLRSLSYYNTLRWPVLKAPTKYEIEHNITPGPLSTQYQNFKALIDFYDIQLYRDEQNPYAVYITGDRDIIEENFMLYKVQLHYDKYYGPLDKNSLTPGFHIFAQNMGFVGISQRKVTEFVKNLLAETKNTVNLVKLYFDTPFDELPMDYQENKQYYAESTFEKLFDCIEIDAITSYVTKERELYWRCYKCWLMGLTRSLYYNSKEAFDPKKMNNCILVLTSTESRYKTSHFLSMLPSFMKDKIAITPHGFANENSVRDLYKLAANNMILVLDEIEKNLNSQTESNLKQLIDSNPQKIIDKWEVIESIIRPQAIFAATSNQRSLKLGSEGSRRIFHIPVKSIDIEAMSKLCWHPIINEIKKEMFLGLAQGRLPWVLTEEELQFQAALHNKIRAKNNLDLILEEIYDYDSEIEYSSCGGIYGVTSFQHDKTGTLKSVNSILNDLASHGHDRFNIKRSALLNSLERLSGAYTKTERVKKELSSPICTIYKGLASQGNAKYWVMPPLKRNLAKEVFANVMNLT